MINYQEDINTALSNCSDNEIAEMYHIIKTLEEDQCDDSVYDMDPLAYIAIVFIMSHDNLPKFRNIFEQEIITRWSDENLPKERK